MKKRKLLFSCLILSYVFNFSEAVSLKLLVQNKTEKPKYVFLRPKVKPQGNVISPYRVVVPHTAQGQEHEIEVDENQIGITDYYDVVAADSDGDPNRKLLGGTCKNLHKDLTHHIAIDSLGGGLKTTCKTQRK